MEEVHARDKYFNPTIFKLDKESMRDDDCVVFQLVLFKPPKDATWHIKGMFRKTLKDFGDHAFHAWH